MSSCIDAVPNEQLCYIPCNFCSIVLAVSVPCSSLFDIVTSDWALQPIYGREYGSCFQSLSWQDQVQHRTPTSRLQNDLGSSLQMQQKISLRTPAANIVTQERVVNRPPEKRQRVPSAYNQFIKTRGYGGMSAVLNIIFTFGTFALETLQRGRAVETAI
ncbi:hypothetical protein D5086_012352 [Populus alba]|uniref:Uncharacterized protein n=1 Tax=Populus alba TaxID=43335 RepID=A0ACC4C3G1_POPAL